MKITIRKFTTPNFTVTVSAEEDYDLDLSWDEDGLVRRDLENGNLCSFTVKASVSHNGLELSHDYLGGCIYKKPAEFMDHKGIRNYVPPGGKAGQCGSYFSDMVRSVCTEARNTLAGMRNIPVRTK